MPTALETDLARTHRKYMKWLNGHWKPERDVKKGVDIVFCHSAWGGAFANLPAREWQRSMRSRGGQGVPDTRKRTWADAVALESRIRVVSSGYELLPWLMLPAGHWERWHELHAVHNVKSKISAWILRDLSFWMDYKPEISRSAITLCRRRDSRWFLALPAWAQAYYLPIDRWVYRACLANDVFSEEQVGGSLSAVQSKPDNHEYAATLLAKWAASRGVDPRLLNTYWYWEGSESGEAVGPEEE